MFAVIGSSLKLGFLSKVQATANGSSGLIRFFAINARSGFDNPAVRRQ